LLIEETESALRLSRRKIALIVGLLVLLIILGVVGLSLYDARKPAKRTVLRVNDTAIPMEYFLTRAALLPSAEPLEVLQTLAYEQIIRQVASDSPYNISVTKSELETHIRKSAELGETLSDSEFKEWRRQQRNETGFSDGELNEIYENQLIASKLSDYLGDRVPTVAEQVRLFMIASPSLESAAVIKARLDGGANFFIILQELVAAGVPQSEQGELGWFPRDTLTPLLAEQAFDVLAVGIPSDPLVLDGGVFGILVVAERVQARVVEEQVRERLKVVAVERWVEVEYSKQVVTTHGLNNGWDSETNAWVKLELQRRWQK
jgi:hypothetical protein